jgi:hypothetical protein
VHQDHPRGSQAPLVFTRISGFPTHAGLSCPRAPACYVGSFTAMKGLGVRVPRRAARSTHQSGAFGATGRFRGAGYPLRSPDSATRGLFLGLTDEVLVGVGFGGHCALEQPLRPNEDSRQPSTQVGPESRSSYRISDGLPVDPENGGETQGARRLRARHAPAGPGQRRFPHLELDGVTLRVSIRSVGRPLLLLTGIGANLARRHRSRTP